MWPSEEIATRIYDAANIGLIASLAIGVISTLLIVWMGNVKEAFLKKYVASTNERAALAEQSAAEANEKAEAEKLARIKIEERMADRTISDEQGKAMLQILEPGAGKKVQIDSLLSEGREAFEYAERITSIFDNSKWEIVRRPGGNLSYSRPLIGVLLLVRDDKESKELGLAVSKAFHAAGIPVQLALDPNIATRTVDIIVGSK